MSTVSGNISNDRAALEAAQLLVSLGATTSPRTSLASSSSSGHTSQTMKATARSNGCADVATVAHTTLASSSSAPSMARKRKANCLASNTNLSSAQQVAATATSAAAAASCASSSRSSYGRSNGAGGATQAASAISKTDVADLFWKALLAIRGNNPDKTKTYLVEAAKLASTDQERSVLGARYNMLGRLYYLKRQEYKEAKTCYVEAIKHAPRVFMDSITLAAICFTLNELDETKRYLAEAVKLAATDQDRRHLGVGYNVLGNLYFKRQEYKEAKTCFAEAIKHTPKGFIYYLNLENTCCRLNELDEAKTYLAEAVKLAATDQDRRHLGVGYNELGNLYFKRQEYKEAKTCYIEAIKHAPKGSFHYSNLATTCCRLNELDEAKTHLAEAVKLAATDEDRRQLGVGYNELGNLHFKRQEYKEAKTCYIVAIKHAQKVSIYYSNLAGSCCPLNELDEAKTYLAEAAKLAATDQDRRQLGVGYNELGNLYFKRQEYKEAKTCYIEAIKYAPKASIYYSNLATTCCCLNELDETKTYLAEAVKLATTDQDRRQLGVGYNELGNLYFKRQEYKEAKTCYIVAIKYAPKASIYYSNLAGSCCPLNELDEAKTYLAEAVKLAATDQDRRQLGMGYNELGNLHFKRQEYKEAKTCYIVAIKHAPKVSSFHYSNLATTCCRLNGLDEAKTYLAEAVKLAATDQNRRILGTPYFELGNKYEEQRQYKEAKASYVEAIKHLSNSEQLRKCRCQIISVCFALGEIEEARRYFDDAASATASSTQNKPAS